MPHGYWDDISAAQRKALQILRDTDNGSASVSWMRFKGVSLSTLRALHRFGLIRTGTLETVQFDDAVYITDHGRTSVESPATEENSHG